MLLTQIIFNYAHAVCADEPSGSNGVFKHHEKEINSKLFKGNVEVFIPYDPNDICFNAELLVYPKDTDLTTKNRSRNRTLIFDKNIDLARIMEATVASDDFKINQITPKRQIINPGSATKWKWDLYPNEGGVLRVTFTLSAVIKIEDKDELLVIDTWQRTVDFNGEYLKENAKKTAEVRNPWITNWKWVVSVIIIIPLLVWSFIYWRSKREESRNEDSPERTTITLFLASSSELNEHRDEFDLYLRRQNDRLLKEGYYLKVIRWEYFLDAMSDTRLQDDYNKVVQGCDIFVSLFRTKTGMYTEEEFDVAHRYFKQTGAPLIYTFFEKTNVSNEKKNRAALISLWDFQDKLGNLGHFYTEFEGIEHLKLKFREQLDKLIEEGKLLSNY